jgi:hypothetical protein
LSVTCDRSVVFSGYSGFLHQENGPPRLNTINQIEPDTCFYQWYSADNFLFHFTNWLIKDHLLNLHYEAKYSDRRVGQVQNTLPKKEYVYYQEIIKGFYLYTLKLLKFNDSNVVQQDKYNWFRWFSPGTPVSSTKKTDRHD